MTISEIKISALKLMFDVGDESFDSSDMEALMADDSYSGRLILMDESIKRAVRKIVVSQSVDDKISTVSLKSGLNDLKALIPDFYSLVGVLTSGYKNVRNYRMLNADNVIMEQQGEYIVRYKHYPTYTSDNDELDLLDEFSRIIPYFIKADLFEEENASLAFASRNIFENELSELRQLRKKDYNDIDTMRIEMEY